MSDGVLDGTLHGLVDDAAAEAPERTAVRDAAGSWTYSRLRRLSFAVAHWLAARGVRPGDRVLVRLPNSLEFVALLHGTSRCGAVFVPVNPAMKAFHLRSVVADAEPALLVVDDAEVDAVRALTPVPVHGLREAWAEVAGLEVAGPGVAGPGVPGSEVPGSSAHDVLPERVRVAGTDLALLIYTSGSTAAPKAVMCPHGRVRFAAAAVQAVLGYRDTDVVFCRLPLSFDYGLYQVLLAALARAEVVLAGAEPEFRLLDAIRDCGATVVPVVPSLASMAVALAARGSGPAAPVRMFTNTGAALPEATTDALRAAFPGARVVRMFGTTECKRITIMPPERDRELPGSVGPALPGTEVFVVDDEGRPLPPGEVGQVVVAGPHVMAGYWRAPELTARTFRRDGDRTVLHTGDYGRLDEVGNLWFTGRRDDLFKRRGARMSTVEIEAAAMDVPGVRAAAVLAPTEGRDLAICVATDLAPHQVLHELGARLEPAKVPAVCHVLPELPLTPNGKNARGDLALLFAGGGR
ncbi:AMP-binding protein [Saccharothrix sp. BKS2]|uniref:AMP-binding protein n=1 Tax=Saccharothrix sp. BKS2 TaxID=3064400 RepID=UPI0039EA4B8A